MSLNSDSISTPILTDIEALRGVSKSYTLPEDMAPSSVSERAITYIGKVPYSEGIIPISRRELPGYNSGVMTMIVAVFFFITLNIGHYSTFLKTFTHNLFSVRRRPNMFDDRNTMSETRVLASLILLTCVSEGILVFSGMTALLGVESDNFLSILSLSGLALLYYLVQYVAYRMVGYIFTTKKRAEMWSKGFSSSQALLGLTIFAPALFSLFIPSAHQLILILSVILYITARIIFISKGFRIFYHNLFSLVYFILYLCTLEIIPLILIYKASLFLTSNL